MDLADLIRALSSPAAYPHPVANVEVRQTHISVVFLAGDAVYKIKKPVNLGFVDFTTLQKRQFFCAEEVRLNRRLAPAVYLGVVPITPAGTGLRIGGEGEAVEWAVQMVRLPDEATLLRQLQSGQVGPELLQGLARRLATFHAGSERGEHVASFGRYEVVAGNANDNLSEARAHVGSTISEPVFARLQELFAAMLSAARPAIEARAARGAPCDTHGDLRLDHVYTFADRAPPGDLVIIDCIEFNERFRYADPIADMAFLVMDLLFHGRPDLAGAFASAYFAASGDREGEALLPLYVAYRAAVRAKVEGIEVTEREVPEAERAAAQKRARAHWLLALGQLEPTGLRRPWLVLVAGLPGAGKSTLARGLAEKAGLTVLRSDVVRKELAAAHPNEDIYAPQWSERTYAECWRRAEDVLFAGGRVLLDANFRREQQRRQFLEGARNCGVPALLLVCRVGPEVARQRLSQRRGDVSDAGWEFYQQAVREWEQPTPCPANHLIEIDAEGPPEQTLALALEALRRRGAV